MTNLDHDGLVQMKLQNPEWIWNRSDTHVILGYPGSPETFKTVVEPGNSFSPGFRSYGVSTWVTVGGQLFAPEELELTEMRWRYTQGYLPVLECTWSAGPIVVSSSLFTDGDLGTRDFRTHLEVRLTNTGPNSVEATAHVVMRSFGPAGGAISELELNDRDVLVNGRVVMTFESTPSAVGVISFEKSSSDIGELLKGGLLPPAERVSDAAGWASGAANFALVLEPGEERAVRSTSFVHADELNLPWLHRARGLPWSAPDRAAFEQEWNRRLPVRLSLPDRRYSDAFQCQIAYLSMSTVGLEPRIAPISYPLWWLRDGAYVLTALEKGGVSTWTDSAIKAVAARNPFGGFGAEGDGAAQLIWLMSEHFLMTQDIDFLREHYDDVVRNAELIIRMRASEAPVFGATEIRTPEMMFSPHADLMAAPAADGLLVGRMDLHFPRFWINGWAWFALTRAAACASALGLSPTRYEVEAESLLAVIRRDVGEHFGENDRDFTGSIWPTGWADPTDEIIRSRFDRFWDEVRFPGGVHVPEPEWTYFEAGQAHNFVLLGQRERAWISIEMFLSQSTAPGLYTYHEGIGDENSSLQWQRSRGWDNIPHVTPHGWTAAEVFLLLRDSLVREVGDDLVIGSGVPSSWMESDFSFENLPTHFGEVSAWYSAQDRTLRVRAERAPRSIRSELPGSVSVIVELHAASSVDAL